METGRSPVEVRGLTKAFGGKDVLRGVDFTVGRGEMYALLGPNGAGKTTTVRILSTLLAADSGSARVAGHEVRRQSRAVRRSIGLTGQYSAVDGLLTGRENLVMMGRLSHLSRAEAQLRAARLLDRLDLVDAAERAVRTYSGGMRRRLDLAASLIGNPPVLFLDEPTTGLDPRSRAAMWEIIRDLLRDGVTILLTTQYLEEADQLADRVGVLSGGTLVAEGTSDFLKRQVGAERLELTFHDTAALRTARAALAGYADLHTPAEHTLSAPVDGARELRRMLELVEHAGAEIARVALQKPTLDDVFLTLTGDAPPAPPPAPAAATAAAGAAEVTAR